MNVSDKFKLADLVGQSVWISCGDYYIEGILSTINEGGVWIRPEDNNQHCVYVDEFISYDSITDFGSAS
jgi:hypothetical protein